MLFTYLMEGLLRSGTLPIMGGQCHIQFHIVRNRVKTISDFKWCGNADEVLEYTIDEDRLRNIITKADVTSKTI